jgi:hypothetical protein
MKNEIRQAIIEINIELLEAQLRTLRKLANPKKTNLAKIPNQMSQIELVYDILKRENKPLHIMDIISKVYKIHNVAIDRESLASALTKKVHKGQLFTRPEKNTFGLKEEE